MQDVRHRPPRRQALARVAALSLAPWLPGVAWGDTVVHALPRRALVIGNNAYADTPLFNPVNDAGAMADELGRFGFGIKLLTNARRESMQEAINAFCDQLARQRAVGFFYFAGHGLQIDWRNYLVPVDARLGPGTDIASHTVDLGSLFKGLGKAGNPMNIVVLDACRNNPFGTGRTTGKGLSQMDAPTGTFLAYATAPGNVAADGDGQHGLYTENILREMKAPEAKIEDIFKRVRLAVRRSSAGQQIPWESTSLEDDFYFKPPATLRNRSEEELARHFEEERQFWKAADESSDSAPVIAYLQRYPSGNFAELAQLRLDKLLARQGEKLIRPVAAPDNPFTKGTREIGEFRVGDEFVYRIVDMLTNTDQPGYRLRVTDVNDREVSFNDGREITDLTGNWKIQLDGTRFDSAQFFVKEYSLGHKWTTRCPIVFRNGTEDVLESDIRVAAFETITTPAGSFDCYRLEMTGWMINSGRKFESRYWFAPEHVSRFIAAERWIRGQWGKILISDRHELTRFSKEKS